jgi:RsmE family RNA methyltransferase
LRDATTVGVGALHFVRTEKAETSYAQSTLWSSGEWRRHVLAGAEQAFDARIPDVTSGKSLAETLDALPPSCRLALDNYESAQSLAEITVAPDTPVAVAIGSERGWSAAERDLLRRHHFTFVHLGPRVLRTETAVVATLTLVHAKRASITQLASPRPVSS